MKPRRDARLLAPPSAGARRGSRGLRRVDMTRLGRATPPVFDGYPALHPGIRARLVGAALLVLALIPLPARAAPAETTGTVVGWARDSLSGKALPYASVVVQGTHLGAMADTSGWFRLAGVPAGERVISALALGFRRGAAPVRVRPARTDTVQLRMRAMPISTLWSCPTVKPRRKPQNH